MEVIAGRAFEHPPDHGYPMDASPRSHPRAHGGSGVQRPPASVDGIAEMTIQVTRVARALGAVVSGVALSDELSQPDIDRLGELLIEHQILFFRGQPIIPSCDSPRRGRSVPTRDYI